MKLTGLQFNPFGEMTYILWHEDGQDAFVVDPGMMERDEQEVFASFVEQHRLNVVKVLITHVHVDHVPGTAWVKERYGASVEFCQDDEFLLKLLPMQYKAFGLNYIHDPFVADKFLSDGDVIKLVDDEIKVLSVPGHSPGSIAFYVPSKGILLSGDAIFAMSIGRTDLPGGSYDQLVNSINEKIMTLPEDTVIYPGHGSCTTVGEEKRYNPFIK